MRKKQAKKKSNILAMYQIVEINPGLKKNVCILIIMRKKDLKFDTL